MDQATTPMRNGRSGNLKKALSTSLTKELRSPQPSGRLPIIMRNKMSGRGPLQLIVIWDTWNDMNGEDRADVIRDAYRASNPESEGRVEVAFGLTASEALSLGYLPYRIVAAPRNTDKVSRRQIAEAMKSAGGVLVQIGNESELRFAALTQAQDAYRELLAKLPGPFWTLVHEQATAESA